MNKISFILAHHRIITETHISFAEISHACHSCARADSITYPERRVHTLRLFLPPPPAQRLPRHTNTRALGDLSKLEHCQSTTHLGWPPHPICWYGFSTPCTLVTHRPRKRHFMRNFRKCRLCATRVHGVEKPYQRFIALMGVHHPQKQRALNIT